MIKLLVADDHAIIREGLKQIITDTRDIIVVDEASNGNEALNYALKKDYDFIVMDISMPDKNGLEVFKEL